MSLLLSAFRRSQKRPPAPPEHCRHCGRREINRRGLCRTCYGMPEIRDRYPRQYRGCVGESDTCKRLPLPEPTTAEPGSEAKIRVLQERYRRRQLLHHPEDARRQMG